MVMADGLTAAILPRMPSFAKSFPVGVPLASGVLENHVNLTLAIK
jgi:hypothetical protein